MPLKVLPTMTGSPPSRSRAPRWMFDSVPVRRPYPHSAPSTTRSSVCTGFTFCHARPRGPAAYGAARYLTMTPSCPAASAFSRSAAASPASGRTTPGIRWPPAARPSASSQRLAVEHDPVARLRADQFHQLGDAVGHLAQRARPHPDLVAVAVHLDTGAVELVLDADLRPQLGQRGVEVLGRTREHRADRTAHLRPHRLQRRCAAGEGEAGGVGEAAGEAAARTRSAHSCGSAGAVRSGRAFCGRPR